MRRLASILAILCALSTAAAAQDTPRRRTINDFHRYADVQAREALQTGQAYGVPLDPDTLAALRKRGELRVFDATGHEVPSMVYTSPAGTRSEPRNVRIFNQAWEPGLIQTLTVELTDRTPGPVNDFTFEITEDAYDAQVIVQSSEDGDTWRIVRHNLHLIRHTLPEEDVKYVHNVLRIPTTRARYFRFMVASSGREKPLTITHVQVRRNVKRGRTLQLPVHPAPWTNPRDADARHHYWRMDFKQPDLGVDRLRLTIADREYARRASLWEWNAELDRPGRRLASAVLFHYGDDMQTVLRGFRTNAAMLVLMIDQGDDAPLRVIGATATRPQQVVRFIMDAGVTAPLRLYVLPDKAQEPQYDLARRIKEQEITAFAPLSLGPLRDNPAYAEAPPPVSERIPYLLYAIVGLLVLVLGAYMARTVRAAAPPEPPEPGV